jgi:hypothetical protein
MVYDIKTPISQHRSQVIRRGNEPIMALWISHRVLLINELIGSRTSRGIPTEMKASILSISFVPH